ncbi:MAG: 50S ribosomal protein P1 [Candidatus Lokiarchaeota archaeon]|nr:50S ribosomal protein P1 [Candidatus Lokiarchaeota archaeon]
METIYAALILHKAQKDITEANIEKILKAANVDVDKTQLTKVVAGLKEADIETIISSAAAAPVMVAPATSAEPASGASKKEKKEEEEEEEEEPTGIGSLF